MELELILDEGVDGELFTEAAAYVEGDGGALVGVATYMFGFGVDVDDFVGVGIFTKSTLLTLVVVPFAVVLVKQFAFFVDDFGGILVDESEVVTLTRAGLVAGVGGARAEDDVGGIALDMGCVVGSIVFGLVGHVFASWDFHKNR